MLCQDGALGLSSLKEELDAGGADLVAVGCSREDADKFVASGMFRGTVFLDEAKVVHRAFDCKVETWLGFVKPRVWWSFFVATTFKGLQKTKTQGDYKQLGGTFVLQANRPDCDAVRFSHLQSRWGEHPAKEDVLASLVGKDEARRLLRSGAPVSAGACASTPGCKTYSASDWVVSRTKVNVTDGRRTVGPLLAAAAAALLLAIVAACVAV